MKLHAQLLYRCLTAHYPLSLQGDLSASISLGRPLLYEDDEFFLDNRIYIIDHPNMEINLAKVPPTTIVVLINVPKGYRSNAKCPLLTVHSEVSPNNICNFIQNVFDEYDQWEEHLLNLSLEGGSIQDLLTSSQHIFKNPLLVISMDFSLIASIGIDSLAKKTKLFDSSPKSIEYINALKQDAFYNRAQEYEEAFIFPAHITGNRSLNVNIRRLDNTTHRLILVEMDHEISEGDYCLLEYLASLVRYALLHNAMHRSSKDKALHSLFLSILSDRTADYVSISQQLSTLGWHVGHKYLCLVLQVTYLDQKNLTINAICNYIENMFPFSCAFQHREDIVIFFNLSKSEMDEEAISDKLVYFIRDSFLKTGYSRIMKGHLNLRRQYIQACIALDVGNRKKPYLWVHHFNDIALSYILEQATWKLPGYMICHEKLLKLQEMDETQNTEYIKTLRVYLDNHLNAVQSAKELYIHRSTFLYRLEKIKTMLETNFDKNDDLLYLMLSFRFLDAQGERDEEEIGEI